MNGCKQKEDDICKRGYDRSETIPITSIDERGFIVYRRRHQEDLKIVPHNPETLLDWDAHLNVEFSATVNHILYMFKYLYKGSKKQSFDLEQRNEEQENDISLYLKGRILCSMDAMSRILGFHTYPKSSPAVKTIKVKLPEQLNHLSNVEKLSCDMLIYLKRPSPLLALKYTEFFNEYVVYRYLPKRFYNRFDLLNNDYYVIQLPHSNTPIFICRRVDPSKIIVRMEMNYINHGEIFYFRLILLKRAIKDINDAYTDQFGVVHPTFQQAAICRGYIQSLEDTKKQFIEFASISSPWELRGHVALMIVSGFPMWYIFENEDYQNQMMQDYLDDGMSHKIAKNRLLQDLQMLLQKSGSSLDVFGFPMPEGMETELEIARLMYSEIEQANILQEMEVSQPNNIEQQEIFDTLTADIDNFVSLEDGDIEDNVFKFISGPGGTGKTAVFKKLQAWCRSQGILISCCAATTLAALLFEGATTAHSLFKYPVVDELDVDPEFLPECRLPENSERLELLLQTKVIFWDEFVSNDRALIEAVIRCLTHRYGKKFIFICAGDFRQILPVVKYGLKAEVIASCISSSPYWNQFNILRLTQNMRLQGLQAVLNHSYSEEQQIYLQKQQQYADFLMDLSENRSSEFLDVLEKVDTDTYKIGLKEMDYFTSDDIDSSIKWLYPNKNFDPNIALQTVVLASTNDAVDGWNNLIQKMNKNVSKFYYSRDSFNEVDDQKGILANILTEDVLNRYNRNGVPTHTLSFKVDDVCIVLRAIPQLSIATNTRVQIVQLLDYGVKVKTLNEPKERYVIIPRITFKFRLEYGESYQLTRMQLPLRLAYAMTYNKAQSQTLKQVLVDCTGEPFAHGHAYVAFSRVRDCDNIKVFVHKDQLHPVGDSSLDLMPVISNIVYKDILI